MAAQDNWFSKPDEDRDGYRRWGLPAHGWSGAQWCEDKIKLVCEDGKWWGVTECDQSDKRDLTDEDIASIRREFGIVA